MTPSRPKRSEVKIAFMGTAKFAVPALQLLFEEGYDIAGVITQPDKPKGRGRLLQSPPVKTRALELHLSVHQPQSLKDAEAHALLKALSPNVIVVVAYGKILPPWIIDLPEYGCINLHGSLLPKYRGAAPVHWAIANGETVTGVCTMKIDRGLDTGPVFLCEETRIGSEEMAEQLYDRLAVLGGPLIVRTIEGVRSGALHPRPQDHSRASTAPMLKKEHGFIDWTMTARDIHNRVRAFNPWPGTVTRLRGVTCKILKTRIGSNRSAEPGTILVSKGALEVACGDSVLLEILSIQPENRKPTTGKDFANGARIQPGEKFERMRDN